MKPTVDVDVRLGRLSGLLAGHGLAGVIFPDATLLYLMASFGIGLGLRARNLRRLDRSRHVVLSALLASGGLLVLLATYLLIRTATGVPAALLSLAGGSACVYLTAMSATMASRARHGDPNAVALRDDLPEVLVRLFVEADRMMAKRRDDGHLDETSATTEQTEPRRDGDPPVLPQLPTTSASDPGVIARLVGSGLGFLVLAEAMVLGGFVARASPPIPLFSDHARTAPTTTTSVPETTTTSTTSTSLPPSDPPSTPPKAYDQQIPNTTPPSSAQPRPDDATWVCAGDPLEQLAATLGSARSAAAEILGSALRLGLDEIGCPSEQAPLEIGDFTIVYFECSERASADCVDSAVLVQPDRPNVLLREPPLEVLTTLLRTGSVDWVSPRRFDGFTWFYVVHERDSSCGMITGNAGRAATYVGPEVTWILFDAVERSDLLFWIEGTRDNFLRASFGHLGTASYSVEIEVETGGRAVVRDSDFPDLPKGTSAQPGLWCRTHEAAVELAPRP